MYLSETEPKAVPIEAIDRLLFSEIHETPVAADTAIVLGCEPKYLENRCRPALAYYRAGYTGRLVVTGGAVHDPTTPESRYMHRILTGWGVPEDAIIEEPNAGDTVGNLLCSLNELENRRLLATTRRITIITEPFHLPRALLLAGMYLPRYVTVTGFTEHTMGCRDGWKTDPRLSAAVYNEIWVWRDLIHSGIIPDIPLT